MKFKLAFLSSILSILPVISLANSDTLNLINKQGKQMTVSVLSWKDGNYVIKRESDNKRFTISLDLLDAPSQKKFSKRRNDKGTSYYMKEMNVSGKVVLKNTDSGKLCPECTGRLIFIGQNQRETNLFNVLHNQKFKLTPTLKGVEFTTSTFKTSYDSDNKGEGNIGGYKYDGYLLVVLDKKENVILTKTLSSNIKKALDLHDDFAKKMMSYPANTILNKTMVSNAKK